MRKIPWVLLGPIWLLGFSACEAEVPSVEPALVTDISTDPRERFAGNWALVRVERYSADGELLPPPEPPAFGAGRPLGFLMYDAAGYMGVVIQQENRKPYASEQRTPDEALAALTTYTSYFGPFTVNEVEGHVTHHVRGHLSLRGVGVDNKRFYEFSGNQLILQPPVGDSGIQLKIVWERVRDLPELTQEQRKFIGFWEIVGVERKTADGESLTANQYAAGYLIYMPSGHMAVHLMRPNRPQYAGSRPSPDEGETALSTYASYFGSFTVHANEGYVVHHRIGNMNPNGVGTDAQRFYEITDNTLILMPPPATIDDQQVQRYIHWNRIGNR